MSQIEVKNLIKSNFANKFEDGKYFSIFHDDKFVNDEGILPSTCNRIDVKPL